MAGKKIFLKSQKSFWQRVLGEISEGVYSFILEGSMRIQLTETHTFLSQGQGLLNKQKSPVYTGVMEGGEYPSVHLGQCAPGKRHGSF